LCRAVDVIVVLKNQGPKLRLLSPTKSARRQKLEVDLEFLKQLISKREQDELLATSRDWI
jgi:hypothetical protein